MKLAGVLLTVAGFILFAGLSDLPVQAYDDQGFSGQLSVDAASNLGPEIYISGSTPASDEEEPAVAYNGNHGEYMVVWYNNRPVTKDIYARRVSKTGQLLSWFTVSTESGCKYPSIAFNPVNDEYLVVWSQFNETDSRWEIYGRIITWNAPGTNSPFLIATWSSYDLELPVVAWNSSRNEYMVVWQTSHNTTHQLLGIGRRRLSSIGVSLSNADYITGEGSTNQGNPDIAYNQAADGYLVVWAQPGDTNINIFGGRLNYEGTLQGSSYAVQPLAMEQQKPAVTTSENAYMVVWQTFVGSDWDVHGVAINSATGVPLPTSYLIAIMLDVDETSPDVICTGSEWDCMYVWQESTPSGKAINAVRWGSNFDAYVFEVAPGGFGDNRNPVVAADIPGYLFVYEWESFVPDSDSDIFGRLWWPEVVYLPLIMR